VPDRRIVAFYRPYARECAAILATIVAASVLNIVSPLFARRIVDVAFPAHDSGLLALLVGGMMAASTGGALLMLVEGRLSLIVGEGILRDMRSALMAHLLALPMGFYRRTKQGVIVNRLVADVDNIEDVAIGALAGLAQYAVQMAVSLVMLCVVDLPLAGVALLIVAGNLVLVRSGGRRQYEARRGTREERDAVENVTQESLSYSGIALMKSFNRELHERERHAAATENLAKNEIALAMSGRYVMLSVHAIRTASLALVWFFGAARVFRGELSLGSLIAFTVYLTAFYTSTETMTAMNVQLSAIGALFERVFAFLDEPAERAGGGDALPAGPLAIRFAGLRVAYEDGAEVLAVDELTVAPGETVALVGASGAGKTTLVGALLRFVEPAAGTISLGGRELSGIADAALRRAVVVVPQEPVIFNASLRENVVYGLGGASDDEVVAALRRARLGDFLAALPRGLDTPLGEQGSAISAGERQRIAIARALVRDPQVVIYDEATSALDAQSEADVLAAMRAAGAGRTTIVIAHRYAMLALADRVVVLERGRVAESGTVDELLAHDGIFAAQYWAQYRPQVPAGAER
jgi:ABC-type multidrug transport system fused ATPase/permease subunit